MKKLFISFGLCLSLITCISQTPFYDALNIRNNFIDADGGTFTFKPDGASLHAVSNLLRNYLPDSLRNKPSLNETQVFNVYVSNDFLKDQANDAIGGASSILTKMSSVLSSIGNLDVTNLADGFAKFLVKRTKEELNVAFFSRFYELMNKDEYRDARTLFPQTYATLSAIGEQIYNYQLYMNTLRESFEKDLNGLLDNLPKVINDGNYKTFFNKHPELKATCLSSVYIGKSLLNKTHPGKIIADYNPSLLDNINIDVKASVQTLQLFSESFRSFGTSHYWVSADSLKILSDDPIALRIYFGLIFQQAKNEKINFSIGELSTILSRNLLPAISSIKSYNDFLKALISQANIVTNNISNISGKERDNITFTDYYDFYNSTLDLIEFAAQVIELPGIKGKINIPEKFQTYIDIARAGANIALDISRKNYGSAVINAYNLYNFAFGGNENDIQKLIESNVAASSAAATLKSDRDENLKTSKSNVEKVKRFLLQYGSFISSVAQAENSDDVAKAIEAAALPSGSSRVKRETPFNVSLNAYTGLFIGHESIKGIKDSRAFNSFGVAAPIGVAISTGQHHWSYSLFISLIDLGAVAAYRFKDDTTAQVPTIQLKNIFSPGIFFSIGIPKTPLSFNLGTQMGPNLRKIDNNNAGEPSSESSNRIYWRYSASICVDIPLLNFYTKSK